MLPAIPDVQTDRLAYEFPFGHLITNMAVRSRSLSIRPLTPARYVGLSAHAARQQALGRLYALVESQPAVLSYVDAYWLLSMCSALMFVCSFLLKENEPGKGGSVSVH